MSDQPEHDEVKRYSAGSLATGHLSIHDEVVLFSDHEKALAEKDKMIEEAEKQAEHWKSHYYNDDDKGRKIAELEQKVAELEKALSLLDDKHGF